MDDLRKVFVHSRKVNNTILQDIMNDRFKPASANYCRQCGTDWSIIFMMIMHVNPEDLNYCPTCGNELNTNGAGIQK